jgi:SSS family solute:Na+ symporter
MQNVLELMLYSYAFMVSLFVPVIGALLEKSHPTAAWSMLLAEAPQFY